MRKAVIISAWSFFRPGARVGMQYIAQLMARSGIEVHYISQPSSPLDALSAERRPRFQRAWLGKESCKEVEPSLIEYFVRAPYPVNKKFWLFSGQYNWYGKFLPRTLTRTSFDVCLHDMSTCYPLLESLKFRKLILRLSDIPEGFAHVAPGILIQNLIRHIATGRYDQTWPVSNGLLEYARGLQPGGNHVLLSNGVDWQRFAVPGNPKEKSAVFVGSLDRWVDQHLLDQTARQLPDWQFDLFGPQPSRREFSAENLHFRGTVDHRELPALLGRYQVGLIPFRADDRLVGMMERPLKFYEYLAAGLGVASTDAGALKAGMGSWAHYGRDAAEFAQAIVRAAKDAGKNSGQRQEYLQSYSWPSIGGRIVRQIEQSLAA